MSKVKSSPNSNYFICKYIKLSIKRHRLAEWGDKNRIQLYVICENAFKFKNAHRLQAKGWKKISYSNSNRKWGDNTNIIKNRI